MRIALVNSTDLGGGAAGFARQLAQGLVDRGHEVAFVVGIQKLDHPWIREVPVTGGGGKAEKLLQFFIRKAVSSKTPPHRIHYFARRILHFQQFGALLNQRRGLEDFALPGTSRSITDLPFTPDILHLNNLHYFVGPTHFDMRRLPDLARSLRLVYTLHDTWSFTGHCAYFLDCDRWRKNCGSCPRLDIYPPVRRDRTETNLRTKAGLYRQLKFTLTTPSRWLLACARESILAPAIKRTAVVPYGIDLDFFRPTPCKETARQTLGIASDERAICFVADNGRATPWRDFGFVEKLVDSFRQENPAVKLVVHEVGSTVQQKTLGNVRYISTGRLPAEGVRQVFQASDLMVYPAKADNFPYVILESLACGTPVLATRVGGLPEEFVDGESGFLFEPGDLAGAKRLLADFLENPEQRARMSRAARQHAEHNYSLDRMVSAYEEIYASA